MNATERSIVEQFAFWEALAPFDRRPRPGHVQVIVGCGTSVHVADSIASTLNASGVPARAVPGHEWLHRPHHYVASGLPVEIVALSRSGASTETVQAARASRAAGLEVLGITCARGSPLCAESDHVILAATHAEEGIVMTASASLMLLAGLRYAGVPIGADEIGAARTLLRDGAEGLRALAEGCRHFVFLGGGARYGIAREAALKMQEMSLSHAEAHHPLEYRHGPLSLIEEGSLVVMLYDPGTRDEEATLASELIAKGARVLGLGGPGTVSFLVGGNAAAASLVCLPLLQMLGEVVARQKGLDTRAPRHLTKVVSLP